MADDRNPHLELLVDKFTFCFPKDLYYSEVGLWIKQEEDLMRLGLSDFAQQRNGDIAFANLLPAGTVLNVGDELASIETVKVNLSLPSPLKGTIVENNAAVSDAPELINQDPYGKGWIAVVHPDSQEMPFRGILDAEAYVALVRDQVETELKT
jgi:glycine cleavage system H protein